MYQRMFWRQRLRNVISWKYTYQSRFMTAFMERNNLRLSWHHPMANKTNTYVNHNLHHESCIDHFVVSSNVYGNIRQHDVNDTPLNPSTHCPVMLVFDTSYRYTYDEPEHVADERPIKIAWHKVNDESIGRYKHRIDELIPNMIMSSDTLFCNNVLCECGIHRSDIDSVCKQLIDVLLRAGQDTLPQCSHRDRGIPYWNDEGESIRETAMFWHWLWVDNDRPRHGHVAAIMRKTRASYHYAVPQIKRRERELRKSKMAESVSTNKQRDIWVETKKNAIRKETID